MWGNISQTLILPAFEGGGRGWVNKGGDMKFHEGKSRGASFIFFFT